MRIEEKIVQREEEEASVETRTRFAWKPRRREEGGTRFELVDF